MVSEGMDINSDPGNCSSSGPDDPITPGGVALVVTWPLGWYGIICLLGLLAVCLTFLTEHEPYEDRNTVILTSRSLVFYQWLVPIRTKRTFASQMDTALSHSRSFLLSNLARDSAVYNGGQQ